MPTYTKVASTPYVTKSYSYESIGGASSSTTRLEPLFLSGIVYKTTNSDPNYRVKIARRLNASQGYTKTWFSYFIRPTSASTFFFDKKGNPNYKVWSTGTMWSIGLVPSSVVMTNTDAADIAVTRLKRKIQSHVKDMNALIPLVELRELRQTIAGGINLSTNLITALIHIKRTKGLSAYKYASEAWLTYNFGIKPLVSEIKSTTESINAFLARTDHSAKLSGKSSSKDSIVRTTGSLKTTGGSACYGATIQQAMRRVSEFDYMVQALCVFSLRSANDYNAMQHFGASPSALVPAAWELTALSWVVDYFTTVGEYLDDTFTCTPVSTVYVNQTRKAVARGFTTFSHTATVHVNNGFLLTGDTGGESSWEYHEFERTVLATIPHRIVRIRTVDEVGKYSLNKLLNLCSVFGVMAKEKPHQRQRRVR
jgi:hypothetical protein